jgi:hypothetical protein
MIVEPGKVSLTAFTSRSVPTAALTRVVSPTTRTAAEAPAGSIPASRPSTPAVMAAVVIPWSLPRRLRVDVPSLTRPGVL